MNILLYNLLWYCLFFYKYIILYASSFVYVQLSWIGNELLEGLHSEKSMEKPMCGWCWVCNILKSTSHTEIRFVHVCT